MVINSLSALIPEISSTREQVSLSDDVTRDQVGVETPAVSRSGLIHCNFVLPSSGSITAASLGIHIFLLEYRTLRMFAANSLKDTPRQSYFESHVGILSTVVLDYFLIASNMENGEKRPRNHNGDWSHLTVHLETSCVCGIHGRHSLSQHEETRASCGSRIYYTRD